MIYILIISLLIKKPFYLLRRQSFSFEIVSEFSNFMSRGWGFWLPVLSRGKGFCTQLLSRGEGFCSLRVVSRGFVPGGMVLDQIDTCIIVHTFVNQILLFFYHIKGLRCHSINTHFYRIGVCELLNSITCGYQLRGIFWMIWLKRMLWRFAEFYDRWYCFRIDCTTLITNTEIYFPTVIIPLNIKNSFTFEYAGFRLVFMST